MKLIFFALMCVSASPAYASDVQVDVDSFTSDEVAASAVLKITNTSTDALKIVIVDCAFLDAEKKAVDVGKAMISGLAPGETAYDKASVPVTGREKFVRCRVSSAR